MLTLKQSIQASTLIKMLYQYKNTTLNTTTTTFLILYNLNTVYLPFSYIPERIGHIHCFRKNQLTLVRSKDNSFYIETPLGQDITFHQKCQK